MLRSATGIAEEHWEEKQPGTSGIGWVSLQKLANVTRSWQPDAWIAQESVGGLFFNVFKRVWWETLKDRNGWMDLGQTFTQKLDNKDYVKKNYLQTFNKTH